MYMMEQVVIDYIEKFILKSGEEIDKRVSDSSAPFIEVKMIRRTERTYRLVGILTLAQKLISDISSIDEELVMLNFTPTKKIQLDDHNRTTLRWLEEGWILREIRFEKDGRTIRTMQFRMGYRLYKYEQDLIRKKESKIHNEFQSWKEDIMLPLSNFNESIAFSNQRKKGIHSLMNILNQLLTVNATELKTVLFFPPTWSHIKRMKFLHFIRSFSKLCAQKEDFDWKEIGASYYNRIGGSKEFDTNKQDFIDLLEEWAKMPVNFLGLTSLGQITPLYFSGNLNGKYSYYDWGPVHALTDLSISQEDYATNAATVWLVENRAILTRVSSERNFLKETNSLMICVDGHLRTAHKQCIHQLLQNSDITQIIIWSDYDQAGLQIANELYVSVISCEQQPLVKWISPEKKVFSEWAMYKQYMDEFLKSKEMEQEQMLGGVTDWKEWIHD